MRTSFRGRTAVRQRDPPTAMRLIQAATLPNSASHRKILLHSCESTRSRAPSSNGHSMMSIKTSSDYLHAANQDIKICMSSMDIGCVSWEKISFDRSCKNLLLKPIPLLEKPEFFSLGKIYLFRSTVVVYRVDIGWACVAAANVAQQS